MSSFSEKKEQLLIAIAKEKTRLIEDLNSESEELLFLDSIWNSKETDQIKLVATSDPVDMLIAIILSDDRITATYSEIKALLEENRQLYKSIDSKEARSLIFTFEDMKKHNLYEQFRTYVDPKNKQMVGTLAASGIRLVLKMAGIRKINFYPMIQTIDNFPNYFDALLCLKTAQDYTKKSRIKEEIDKSARKVLDSLGLEEDDVKKDFDISTTKKIIFAARNYYDRKKQASLSEKKAIRRELTAYESLEENLEKMFNHGEIKNVSELLRRISNPNIRLELLKLVYLHNQKIYDEISTELEKETRDPSNIYQSLLDDYGISPELYQIADVRLVPLDELKNMLESLKALAITEPRIILEIIKTSNFDTIQNIRTQVSKGIIDSELLKNNLAIFSKESKEYKNFIGNLEFFIEEGFNPHYLRANQEIFLLSPTQIKVNIKVLQEYDLLSAMKTGMDSRFLLSENLSENIDTLLELGYETYLVEDISLLNYSSRFNRLRLMKALNHEISSKEELLGILSSEKFFVPDAEIKNYIYNSVPYNLPSNVEPLKEPKKKNPDLTRLTEYESTPRTYVINGVIFSKNKTARNLSLIETSGKTSDRLLYGLLKDSVLTDEEVKSVKSTLLSTKTANQFIKKA